jgi:hypothetical protein
LNEQSKKPAEEIMLKKISIGITILVVVAIIVSLGITLNDTKATLAETRANLAAKSAQLTDTQNTLSQTTIELTDTRNDLTRTTGQLNDTKDELQTAQTQLTSTKSELSSTKTDLATANVKITTLGSQLQDAQTSEANAKKVAADLTKSILLYQETFGMVFQGQTPLGWNDKINDGQPVTFGQPLPANIPAPERYPNLIENPNATNPTYAQLLTFLRTDTTDMYRYIKDYFMCGNFAETLHNRAEAAGIRTGFVIIWYNYGEGHAIDAFVTTDQGLKYVDDTGSETPGPSSLDSTVTMKIGSLYQPVFLFPSGYYFIYDNKRVTDIEIYF